MEIDIFNPFFEDDGTHEYVNVDDSKFDFDEFAEWAEEHLEEHGVYEVDEWDTERTFIQIPDENKDWEENLKVVANKIKSYFKTK